MGVFDRMPSVLVFLLLLLHTQADDETSIQEELSRMRLEIEALKSEILKLKSDMNIGIEFPGDKSYTVVRIDNWPMSSYSIDNYMWSINRNIDTISLYISILVIFYICWSVISWGITQVLKRKN